MDEDKINTIDILPQDVKNYIFKFMTFEKCVICGRQIIYYQENTSHFKCSFLCNTIYIIDISPMMFAHYSDTIVFSFFRFCIIVHYFILYIISSIFHIALACLVFIMSFTLMCILSIIVTFYRLITALVVVPLYCITSLKHLKIKHN